MVFVSISIVLGTAFLSNDMRNLRIVLKRAGLDWLEEKPVVKVEAKPAAPPPAPPAKTIALNPRLWQEPEPNVATALRRIWQMTGPDMCRALRKAGIEVSEWKPAAIGAELNECSYEKIYRKEGERTTSSLFVMVRGDKAGRITSMRAKLVDPPRKNGGELDPALVSLFETMLSQSRWGDFEEQLKAIRGLRDVRKEGFGAAMSFTREFDNDRNFNFLLTLKAVTPDQKRTNDLLRAENGFGLAQPEDMEFHGLPGSPGMIGGPPAFPPPPPAPLPRALPQADMPDVPPEAVPTAEASPREPNLIRTPKETEQERRDRQRIPLGASQR